DSRCSALARAPRALEGALRCRALLLEGLRRALLQFGGRNVLDMGADVPAVACRIHHAAAAVAVELVGRLHERLAAGLERLLINGVDVRNVEIEHVRGDLRAL